MEISGQGEGGMSDRWRGNRNNGKMGTGRQDWKERGVGKVWLKVGIN